ncbi:unnamed protein product [Larinioides sclopetarius]|uniref:Uncharacterized protein n=1 Tax=Larinioides sclopetarius TaxID=280406 RepID=A0AAV2ADA6_9ARAC
MRIYIYISRIKNNGHCAVFVKSKVYVRPESLFVLYRPGR